MSDTLPPLTSAELADLKANALQCPCTDCSDKLRLIDMIERRDEQIERLREALTFAKPIVGAAVAKSDNEGRPQRQKVYTKISEALAASAAKHR